MESRERREVSPFNPPEYRRDGIHVTATATAQHAEVQVVCDEATRKAMMAAREEFLKDAKRPAHSEQLKLEARNRSVLLGFPVSEDKQQPIVQPGTTFTPFWEPWGVSEDDLNR